MGPLSESPGEHETAMHLFLCSLPQAPAAPAVWERARALIDVQPEDMPRWKKWADKDGLSVRELVCKSALVYVKRYAASEGFVVHD